MPSPRFHVRPAVEADLPQILEMLRELAVFEKLENLLVATVDDLRKTLLEDPGGPEALVAEPTDKAKPTGPGGTPRTLLGYAIFFENYSTFLARRGLYLEDVYVRPDHRRRGVGKLFLQRLAQIAAQRQCGRIEWAVLDWNHNAIDFYESIGARVLDEWRLVRMEQPAIGQLAAEGSPSAADHFPASD